MKTIKILLAVMIVIDLVAVSGGSYILLTQKDSLGGYNGPEIRMNRFDGVNVSTTNTLVANTSEQILASSTDRMYAIIGNAGLGLVYLSLDSDKAAIVGKGIVLHSSSTYALIPGENLYTGGINAISLTTPVLTITEVISTN